MKRRIVMSSRLIEASALLLVIRLVATPVVTRALQGEQHGTGGQRDIAIWVPLSPAGAPFTLSLPRLPLEKTDKAKPGIKIHTYRVKTGSSEYQVVWVANVPESMLNLSPLSGIFPNALDNIVRSTKPAGQSEVSAAHEEGIALNGYRGRRSVMDLSGERIDAKGFVTGHDVVTLAVVHSKEDGSALANSERFLESLYLLSAEERAVPMREYADSEVNTRPHPLSAPRPDYTVEARKDKVQGSIMLKALVGPDGRVKDV